MAYFLNNLNTYLCIYLSSSRFKFYSQITMANKVKILTFWGQCFTFYIAKEYKYPGMHSGWVTLNPGCINSIH